MTKTIEDQRSDLLMKVINGEASPSEYNRFCIANGIGEKSLTRITDSEQHDPDTVTIKRSELEEVISWLSTIRDLHKTMTYCGNFSDQYKSGSKDGMIACSSPAEQCIKILETALGEKK